MFDYGWRKKYEKNLEQYKEYLRNDYNYVEYYKKRIKEIIDSTPYSDMNYKLEFKLKTLEINFFKDTYRAKVLISAETFEHYNYFTEEYMKLSDNVRKSYKRSLLEALTMRENEYVQEMSSAFCTYMNRIDEFVADIASYNKII